jgi:hypothetical protein
LLQLSFDSITVYIIYELQLIKINKETKAPATSLGSSKAIKVTHLDNLHPQLVVIGIAPFVETEPLRMTPVDTPRLQMLLGYCQPQLQKKQDRQCTYNVTLRHLRETIVVVEKQEGLHTEYVRACVRVYV